MIRFIIFSVCLMMLAGCNKSPEQKIEEAQEKVIDVKAQAQKQHQEAAQDVNKKQGDLNKATSKAERENQESRQKVQAAHENMAKVQAEVAKDKADAQDKLNSKLKKLEERVGKLTQRPANTDAVKQSKFAETMTLVNANLADARTKVASFAQISPSEWQGPYETASNALARLEDSIRQAD